jgi:pantoate--beta-alanine ligase
MRLVRSIAEVRRDVGSARAAGKTVALVPTMGAFHAGHEALMRAARESSGFVVVSLFVNPTQFDQVSDLSAYPRAEDEDARIAARAGVDLLFVPSVEKMYPAGFATTVSVDGISEVLEGAHRPGHFAGVTTVVCKLLHIVAPDVAWFGRKDAQQLLVIRRLVADLDLPVTICALPTVREPDGLALSSRNRRLSADERRRAVAVPRALAAAARAVEDGDHDPASVEHAGRDAAGSDVDIDYFAVVEPMTLATPARIAGPVLLAVAARAGAVRLIDNRLAVPAALTPTSPSTAQEIA